MHDGTGGEVVNGQIERVGQGHEEVLVEDCVEDVRETGNLDNREIRYQEGGS